MKPVFYSPLVIAVFIFVAFFFDFINVVDYDVGLTEYRFGDTWVFGNNLETTMLIVLGVSLFVFLLTLLYFAWKINRSSVLVFFGIIGSSIISFLFFVFVAFFASDHSFGS